MAELKIQEHFRVPEGYFDNLAEQVMNALPEQEFQPMKIGGAMKAEEHKRRIIPMWTRYAAAACVAGLVMVSAFTAFYNGSDGGQQKEQAVVAAVTTTITDSARKVAEVVAPAAVSEQPVLAKAEVRKAPVPEVAEAKAVMADKVVAEPKVQRGANKSAARQSYDVDVNTGYDLNDMEQAAMYMGIDHQAMCEMMYEDL